MFSKKNIIILLLSSLAVVVYLAFFIKPDKADERSGLITNNISENGLYKVILRPEEGEPSLGPIHNWIVDLANSEGDVIENAKIKFDGGMPAHGHGLPTKPEVVEEFEPGKYRVEGVKFSMVGLWEINLEINGQLGQDKIKFQVVLD